MTRCSRCRAELPRPLDQYGPADRPVCIRCWAGAPVGGYRAGQHDAPLDTLPLFAKPKGGDA